MSHDPSPATVVEWEALRREGADRRATQRVRTGQHEFTGEEAPPPTGPDDYGLPVGADEGIPALSVTAAAAAPPLEFVDASDLEGTDIAPRTWLVKNRLPAGAVCLLQGDGAAGKTTIALQLLVATILGTDWLGAVIDTKGGAMFLSAEEDGDEIHRRLDRVLRHARINFSDLKGLQLCCRPGEDMVLGAAGKDGVVRATPLFQRLENAARQSRPVLIVIEAAADVFAGNENDRSQVRQFIGLLRRLALASGATVLLLAHPSLHGLSSGSGSSGSTGWNNSVRSRLYFSSMKRRDDSDEADTDIRQLQLMKSNYGPAGETVKLRWRDGVFVPDSGAPSAERMRAEADVDALFMKLLENATAQGRSIGPSKGKNYAPAVFAGMPGATGTRAQAFATAMERLFAQRRIRVEEVGPPAKRRSRLVVWTPSNTPSNTDE